MAEQNDQVVVEVCSLEGCKAKEVADQLKDSLHGQTIGGRQVSVNDSGCISYCGLLQRVDVSIDGAILKYAGRGNQSTDVQELGDDPVETIRAAIASYDN